MISLKPPISFYQGIVTQFQEFAIPIPVPYTNLKLPTKREV